MSPPRTCLGTGGKKKGETRRKRSRRATEKRKNRQKSSTGINVEKEKKSVASEKGGKTPPHYKTPDSVNVSQTTKQGGAAGGGIRVWYRVMLRGENVRALMKEQREGCREGEEWG